MVIYLAALLMLIPAAVSDMRRRSFQILPPLVVFAASLVYIFFSCEGDNLPVLVKSCEGGVPGLLFLAAHMCSGDSIGMGDVVMVLLLGVMTGAAHIFLALLLALICVALAGTGRALVKRVKIRGMTLPFIPFLTAGHILGWMIEAAF